MASGEDELIARYFGPLATDPGALGLVDDAAVLAATGDDLVVTTDALVEGVHFLPDDPPDAIARKALRVNLSDLAAKGAEPCGFLLTLALRSADDGWLAPFARALGEDAAAFGCPLLGGDTVSTPGPLMISITAFGAVPPGRWSGATARGRATPGRHRHDRRRRARPRPAAGPRSGRRARTLSDAERAFLIDRYRVPQPRARAGARGARARRCGDGRLRRARRRSRQDVAASGVERRSWRRDRAAVGGGPGELGRGAAALARVLAGGDDYEMLCAVAPERLDGFLLRLRLAGVPCQRIGTPRPEPEPLRVRDADASEMPLTALPFQPLLDCYPVFRPDGIPRRRLSAGAGNVRLVPSQRLRRAPSILAWSAAI